MIPDVNVLVAAFRSDHSHHGPASTWLQDARFACARGSKTLRILPTIVASFLRLVTNPRVFSDPETTDDAIGFIDRLLTSPGVELVTTEMTWPMLRQKLLALGLAGNDISDAWIASAVEALSEHLVTFDRDFARLLAARNVTLLVGRR